MALRPPVPISLVVLMGSYARPRTDDAVEVVCAATRLGRETEVLIEAAWGYAHPAPDRPGLFATPAEERHVLARALDGVPVAVADVAWPADAVARILGSDRRAGRVETVSA